MQDITEIATVQVVPPGAVEAMERASIDIQIATAHKYPRSLERFQKTAMNMVTQDEDTAGSCLYSRPVGKDQSGRPTYAEGMSIRMAEIVAASYGNIRVGAKIIEQNPRQVTAMGFCHDLESNYAATSEVIESTVDRNGRPYSERMAVVVAKAALSKATRDAIFKVIPRALCKGLEDSARKTALGDVASLEKRRAAVMEWIGKLGVAPARVFAALGIGGVADIGLVQLETLTGLKTSIKDGEVSVEEAFPQIAVAGADDPGKSKGENLAAKLGGKKGKQQDIPNPTPAPAAEPVQPVKEKEASREELVAEITPLYDAAPAKKVGPIMDRLGIKWQEGEPWEMAPVEKLMELRRMLKV